MHIQSQNTFSRIFAETYLIVLREWERKHCFSCLFILKISILYNTGKYFNVHVSGKSLVRRFIPAQV